MKSWAARSGPKALAVVAYAIPRYEGAESLAASALKLWRGFTHRSAPRGLCSTSDGGGEEGSKRVGSGEKEKWFDAWSAAGLHAGLGSVGSWLVDDLLHSCRSSVARVLMRIGTYATCQLGDSIGSLVLGHHHRWHPASLPAFFGTRVCGGS